jgi:hypothetical protein
VLKFLACLSKACGCFFGCRLSVFLLFIAYVLYLIFSELTVPFLWCVSYIFACLCDILPKHAALTTVIFTFNVN